MNKQSDLTTITICALNIIRLKSTTSALYLFLSRPPTACFHVLQLHRNGKSQGEKEEEGTKAVGFVGDEPW